LNEKEKDFIKNIKKRYDEKIIYLIFSDPHFGHKNIVRSVSSWDVKSGCRDFNSIEEMNENNL
jgi:hypothetical protein